MGEQLDILWNRQEDFLDMSEPFEFRYKERQDLGGHMFRHVVDGLYMAEDAFPVTAGQSEELRKMYPFCMVQALCAVSS